MKIKWTHLRSRLNRAPILAVFFVLATSSVGHAAQYQVQPLGETLQSYSEHRMGINASDDVAWSQKVGSTYEARVTTGGSSPAKLDLHALAGDPVRSYAEDLNDDKHVVGYTTNSARETFSSAAFWVWDAISTSYTYVDLGASTVTQIGGVQAETSAAYAISPHNVAENVYYVAGYARKVAGGSNSTLSQPVLWKVRGDGTVLSMTVLGLGGIHAGGYGIAYGVTANGVAAGGASTVGGYLSAVTWASPAHSAKTVPSLTPSGNEGEPFSSIANRIRSIDLDGTPVDVAVGHVFMKPTSNDLQGTVESFVYELGLAGADHSVSLGGSKSGLMDVGVQTFGAGYGSLEKRGLQPVGFSTTTGIGFANSALGSKDTLGARYADIGDHADTCDINDALPAASLDTIRFLQAINAQGSVAGWRADGQAVRVIQAPTSGDLIVQVRDVAAGLGQAAAHKFWVNYNGSNELAAVQLSNSAGCATLATGCGDGRMDLSAGSGPTAGFNVLADTTFNGQKMSEGKLLSDIGNKRPSEQYDWIQAVTGAGAACGLTPVLPIQEAINPAGPDPWGEGYWCKAGDNTATTGADLNIRENVTACGTGDCSSHSAVATYDCADRQCNNGVHGQDIHAGSCLISSECYTDAQINPHPANTLTVPVISNSDGCSNTTVQNPCVRCMSGSSNTSWTDLANTTCCTSANQPKLDTYDTTGNQQNSWYNNSTVTCALDRNNGRNRGAWWVDERNLKQNRDYDDWQAYYQESRWSKNGVCNLHSNTDEPQILPRGPNRDTAGHVRRIRGHFTPGIDTHDWYGVVYDDSPDSAVTPKPRGRLISHGQHPSDPSRKVRLQMCMYTDVMEGNRNNVELKRVQFRAGRGKFYESQNTTSTSHYLPLTGIVNGVITGSWLFDTNNQWTTANWNPAPVPGRTQFHYDNYANMAAATSPAHDGRGPCFETDDSGLLDFTIADYDNTKNAKEEAWVYYAVSLVDSGVSAAICHDIKYTLFYGNDHDSAGGFAEGGNGSGCESCCDEGPW